jgi:antitoxin component of RelBE/YafQ-DinJ toxin-antitoxin module
MQLTTEINQETKLKLERRAARIGVTPEEAVRIIATKGVPFFLALLVGATKATQGLKCSGGVA